MNELKCPKCGTSFKIDESDYASILSQVRDNEFKKEITEREKEFLKDKENSLKLMQSELEKKYLSGINQKEKEIDSLKNELSGIKDRENNELERVKLKIEGEYKEEIKKLELKLLDITNSSKEKELKLKSELEVINSTKDLEIENLKNDLESKYKDEVSKLKLGITKLESDVEIKEKEYLLKEQNLKETFDLKIKDKDELISYYKDLKAKQSTKMIGETLESHCNYEFNRIRPMFSSKTYFEKDNDVKTGSKGDFIFRDYDEDGNEIVSIMFEMKNEADTTSTKHKNEDFFKELDKDRKEKKCEYAILVTLLEKDNETYNVGITDVSYKYEKMYVIRPQFFVPIITMLRNASLKSLEYKKQLILAENQNIDISNFEENINKFKDSFSRNYRLASEKFKKAIEEIDKTIDHLYKTRESLISSENNLRIANNKAEDLTIKKLVGGNKTMIEMFENEKETEKISN